jgi:two-component system CheB/CheR fusion protein
LRFGKYPCSDSASRPCSAKRKPAARPDVALLDLGLPILDGFELGRRLRERFPELHLVAVTGYGQEGDKERSRAAGFAQHLVKPVDVATIAALLEGACPVSRARGGDRSPP